MDASSLTSSRQVRGLTVHGAKPDPKPVEIVERCGVTRPRITSCIGH